MRKSKQKKHGGGKFQSERQRRLMWARFPRAAKKWAHNRRTRRSDWVASKGSVSVKRVASKRRR